MERFGMIFGTQGGVQSENSDKLEFADLLNENAMFLRSQGLQNEAKIIPKRAGKRKKSREEGKRRAEKRKTSCPDRTEVPQKDRPERSEATS